MLDLSSAHKIVGAKAPGRAAPCISGSDARRASDPIYIVSTDVTSEYMSVTTDGLAGEPFGPGQEALDTY